ncbi:hypothetical protein CSHISOI_11301 [Colletotrichum shisoi]|uniref:Uncharacterized protein n=1 Tax=Colletotrichum shisoi TaxID=2078593 RepID=A0A5Q4BB22_9PEZI|nr:hypothetical protein CSHISOI_11301 [Colletotrichum shisoi]
MDFNTVEDSQSNVASQPPDSASSSRYTTYSFEACRLASSDPVSQPDDSSHHAPSNHGGLKRMYAERDVRLLDGYFSRLGSKIQHAKHRKARKLAQRRRLLQDGKR